MPPKGIQAQQYGIRINRNLFFPSTTALATLGVMNDQQIHQAIDTVIEGIQQGRITDTPLTHRATRHGHDGLYRALLDAAKRGYGTHKLISWPAITTVNLRGNKATHSPRDMVSMRIEQRRERKGRGPMNITLEHAIITSSTDATSLIIRGGSTFVEKSGCRGMHHAAGLEQDQKFLKIMRQHGVKDFDTDLDVIDYYRGAALLGLDQLVRHQPHRISSHKDIAKNTRVVLPFNFSTVPQYAFETLFMHCARPEHFRQSDTTLTGKVSLGTIDQYLLDKQGYITSLGKELLENRIAVRDVLLDRSNARHFPHYSWAIIQAIEAHMLLNRNRQFDGFSVEFTGTPYQTLSIAYRLGPPRVRGAEDAHKDFDIRIVYDDHFGLPYVMYRIPDEALYKHKWYINDRDPAKLINISSDRKITPYTYKFQDEDWKTPGRRTYCEIFEPSELVLHMAQKLSKHVGYGVTAKTMRGWYIDAWKQRRPR